jgi:hypothetical protein
VVAESTVHGAEGVLNGIYVVRFDVFHEVVWRDSSWSEKLRMYAILTRAILKKMQRGIAKNNG